MFWKDFPGLSSSILHRNPPLPLFYSFKGSLQEVVREVYPHEVKKTMNGLGAAKATTLKRMFNHPEKRDGKVKTISGEDAFDSPREIDRK